MKRSLLPTLTAALLCAGTICIHAAPQPAPKPAAPARPATSDPAAVELLRTLEKQHAEHQRASGAFSQRKVDPIFLEDIRSSGTFYYERPGRFYAHYAESKEARQEASTHWVIDDFAYSYVPSARQLERYRLRRQESGISEINPLSLAFGMNPELIVQHFVVRQEPTTTTGELRLAFYPKARPEDQPFKVFRLNLRQSDLQPASFEVVGMNDDLSVVRIGSIAWNPPAQPDRFRMKVLKGERVPAEVPSNATLFEPGGPTS